MTTWQDIVEQNSTKPSVSEADLEAVAAYNEAGLDEVYGKHFADPEFDPTGQEEEAAQAEMDELAAWLKEQTWSDFAQDLAAFHGRTGFLSEKQLDAAKSMKAKSDARQKTEREPLNVEGLYHKDGRVYKVVKSANGNFYAKVLEVSEETWDFQHGAQGGKARFEYVGKKPLYELTEDDALTAEVAIKIGKAIGRCAVCGATLTDPESIERGIGPICVQGL